jgi:predicted flap endonuclease-1-like 5' DNA nuclease
MLAQPANPQPTEDVCVPRKWQIPLDANGKPVTSSALKKKKSAPEQTGKKKTMPAKPALQKNAASKSVPEKAASAKCKPSVEIEDVADEDNLTYSE